jgi:hypothetical protein
MPSSARAKSAERRHAAANRPGWAKVERWKWRHESGWEVRHCGHPTALWPYYGQHPDGRPFLIPNGYADTAGGYAFQYLADAQEAVEREVAAGSPYPKAGARRQPRAANLPCATRPTRAEATLTAILPAWRDAVAPVLGATFIDDLLRRHRARVVDLIERWLRGDLQAADTSDELADRLVALSGIVSDPRVRGEQGGRPLVLDPSVGRGLAAAVVRATRGTAWVDACDVDPEAAEAAKTRLAAEFAKVGKRAPSSPSTRSTS